MTRYSGPKSIWKIIKSCISYDDYRNPLSNKILGQKSDWSENVLI